MLGTVQQNNPILILKDTGWLTEVHRLCTVMCILEENKPLNIVHKSLKSP